MTVHRGTSPMQQAVEKLDLRLGKYWHVVEPTTARPFFAVRIGIFEISGGATAREAIFAAAERSDELREARGG